MTQVEVHMVSCDAHTALMGDSVKAMFDSKFFKVHWHRNRPNIDTVTFTSLSECRYNISAILRQCTSGATVIIALPFITTMSSVDQVSTVISRMSSAMMQVGDVAYLHSTGQDCSNLKPVNKTSKTSQYMVYSGAAPVLSLAMMLSGNMVAKLLKVIPDDDITWGEFMTAVRTQQTGAAGIQPNLLHPSKHIVSVFPDTTHHCHTPIRALSKDGNTMWSLVWLLVIGGLMILLILLLWR